MRILLIRTAPPGLGRKGIVPPGLAPPLGLLLLSASLRRHRGTDEVRILDAGIDLGCARDIESAASDFAPDLIGLSGLSMEAYHVDALASACKRVLPDVPVLLGGPIANAHPLGVLDHIPSIDASASGEGETIIIDVVERLEKGGGLSGIPGIAVRDEGGRPVAPKPAERVEDLADLPEVDWSEIDLVPYNHALNWSHVPLDESGCAHINTSRGCPYDCSYCHKFFGKKVRALSPRAVVDEMERIVREYGVRDFHFIDDIFNYKKGRIRELCREIQSRGLDVRFAFANGLRGDLLEPDDVTALSDSGLYYMALSVETVTPRLQDMIRKRLDVEKVFDIATNCSDAGLLTRVFVMLGFPTETAEEMKATVRRVIESDFNLASFFTVTPYPGTQLFETAVENGFDPRGWVKGAFKYDRDFVNTSDVDDARFEAIFRNARRDFYERPSRIRWLRDWIDRNGIIDHDYIRSVPPWTTVLEKTGAL